MAPVLLAVLQMNTGIRNLALIAYVALCVYLVAQPSPNRLVERAQMLDQQFSAEGRATLAPALATALDMPVAKVDAYLSRPNSRPSDLIFAKLLEECGV